MDKDILAKYRKAHDISDEVLDFARPMIVEGAKMLEVAETIESKIKELGGKPPWPVNLSVNEMAAHVTPGIGDESIFKDGDMVKVDIGVHVNGYISDRAFTVVIGKKTHPMIETSKKATEAALKMLEPGVKVRDVSALIEDIVSADGYRPIRNLAGHSMGQYSQHESPSIPNGKNNDESVIEGGKPYAIEVFVTDGAGWVRDSKPTTIYKFYDDKPTRMPEARKILEMAKKDFDGLPFTQRWIKEITPLRMEAAIHELVRIEALEMYPPLKEEAGGLVAVTEDTKVLE